MSAPVDPTRRRVVVGGLAGLLGALGALVARPGGVAAEVIDRPPIVTRTSSYVLRLSDEGAIVEMNSSSATTLTVPSNTSVAFPVGGIVEVARMGSGTVKVSASSGVVIQSPGGLRMLRARYSNVGLRKRAINEWVLTGDLA